MRAWMLIAVGLLLGGCKVHRGTDTGFEVVDTRPTDTGDDS